MKSLYEMLIIGGSAGSLEVILQVLSRLKPDLNIPIVIVMHRNLSNETRLVNLLATKTSLRLKEAEEKEIIVSGTIYIAPPDYHLLIEKNHSFSLDDSERVHHSRPSIDVSFESGSLAYGSALIGMLLSGANADGAESLKFIKERGGLTVAQNPESADRPYMPQQAIDKFQVDLILDMDEIADVINEL